MPGQSPPVPQPTPNFCDRLRALAVERAQVDVDETPAVCVRDLGAQPVHAVVVAAHPDQRGAVDRAARDLGPLEVLGRRTTERRPAAAAAAAVAFARLPVEAQPTTEMPSSTAFETATDAHPVLERERRVAGGVVLDPKVPDPEPRTEPGRRQPGA